MLVAICKTTDKDFNTSVYESIMGFTLTLIIRKEAGTYILFNSFMEALTLSTLGH
jgi:hypothetical protein